MSEDTGVRGLKFRGLIPIVLALFPLFVAVVIRLMGGIRAETLSETVKGAGGAALGGILTGMVADRFIRRKRGDVELFIGLSLATALGVLTIGYLYLIQIRGPIASIGDVNRSVEQVTAFLTYLFSQTVGIQIARRTVPNPERSGETVKDGRG
jgi:hypothetical protein